ncbi:alpha/beta hydrolase [Galbitalea soli]|uniref:Alpha/beta hydrolase n=1 Tax=Galbitalea soli TaxID=1268042 RepID=A0A7C9PNV8_9MICO|nr:alpha/beta hydrolase [Galbitalea soli]NEM91932.1 alpha/beta hydrolase [Galbitalea soli]NYJ29229.1 acetyl esterase/lipase [Galbitalea soli]
MHARSRPRPLPALIAIALAGALGLAGCSSASPVSNAQASGAHPAATAPDPYAGVTVHADLPYAMADGAPLLLDLCVPRAATSSTTGPHAAVAPRPAIVEVHGGSWALGDKSGWRSLCEFMASRGFVTASIDYRLAPQHPFPAALDDLRSAVEWLRDPAQVSRFAIDPTRIGAFGGSAGGNLVSLLGTSGSGRLDAGSRVAAVAELSAPIDLTSRGRELPTFVPFVKRYLHCARLICPAARAASPQYQIDPTDPPFFVAHSTAERIPLSQATNFVAALRASAVPVSFVTVPGSRHATALLSPALLRQIVDFFRSNLATSAAGKVIAGGTAATSSARDGAAGDGTPTPPAGSTGIPSP